MKLAKLMKASLGALALSVGLAGASQAAVQKDLSSESVLETIKKRGVLKVGMATFVPWAMRDKKGNLVGFEIDVATKLAADMGVKVEFVPTAWSGIIPAMIARKFDVIIGGMTITAKRNLTVNFTLPYAHSGQQLVASKALAGGFKIKDFNASNVTIACRRGSTACSSTKKLFPKAQMRRFDDDSQSFQELVNGNAHAMISSAPKPRFWMSKYPEKLFLPSEDNITRGNEAFALRKGDPDALNFFSNWITVNTSNGWLQETNDFWFKTQDWADQVDIKQ